MSDMFDIDLPSTDLQNVFVMILGPKFDLKFNFSGNVVIKKCLCNKNMAQG